MIFEAMGWVLRQEAKCIDKMVLLMLAYRLNPETGVADPSIAKMAKDCGLGKTAVRAALQRLEDAGLLTSTTRTDSQGNNLSNHYAMPWEGRVREAKGGSPPDEPPLVREADPKAVKSFSSSSPSAKLNYCNWPALPSEQLFSDWLKVRAAKKAPVTQTVVDRIGNQLHLAQAKGWSVEEAMAECVVRNWRGFEAEWLIAKEKGQPVRTALGTTPNNTRSGHDTGSRQGGHQRPQGGAIDRVLANARAREAAASGGAGSDWSDDDGGVRP
jgi:helix-turn-helix protein